MHYAVEYLLIVIGYRGHIPSPSMLIINRPIVVIVVVARTLQNFLDKNIVLAKLFLTFISIL